MRGRGGAGRVLGLVAACAVGASACVATEQSVASRGVIVSGPPPAPMADERPPPPSGASVWIAGYWHWTGMQYAWIPGHWESGPPGAAWAAPRYVKSEGGYYYEAGRWRAAPAAGASSVRASANALH